MKLEVRYRTLLTYDAPIYESHNEVRARPADTLTQQVLEHDLSVQPATQMFSFTDVWGTHVDAFGVREPHQAMEVISTSLVETWVPVFPEQSPPRSALHRDEFIDEHFEYLGPSSHTEWGTGVRALAASISSGVGDSVVSLTMAIHERVGAEIAYEPGVTSIGNPVEDVLAGGAGVCQDYAHLALAVCRELAIPARYVSGYFFTSDRSDPNALVHVQTHAWLETAVPGWGWLGLDPTNKQRSGEHHVKIGHGRDYDDVAPMRGTFVGSAKSTVEASVEMNRSGHGAPRVIDTESEYSFRLAQAQTSAIQEQQQQ